MNDGAKNSEKATSPKTNNKKETKHNRTQTAVWSLRFVAVGSRTCMVTHIARVWINRVWLPILLVVSWTGKNNISLPPFAPENLVSRDGFGSPVLRQPAHSPYSGWIWCLLMGFLPSSAAASIYYLFKTAIRHRVSPEFIGSRKCVPMAFTAESPPAQGQ